MTLAGKARGDAVTKPGPHIKHSRILIVDDEPTNVRLLERMLEKAGYTSIESTSDPTKVAKLYGGFDPDLILLDLIMPGMDGHAVMADLGPRIPEGDYLPILVLTADVTQEAKERSLASGARDFLTKPFDATEVLLRVKNLLETRGLHMELQHYSEGLEHKVRERTFQLEKTQLEILDRLALAAEFRDYETGEHTTRVGRMAAQLARAISLSEDEAMLIGDAARLHDVGKIAIPDGILLKPGKLTVQEFEQVKTHVDVGARLLSGGEFPLLIKAEEIAANHHEKWDGTGYKGVAGDAIPISARVSAVADVFDALTHKRPYKEAWPAEVAVAEIESQNGRHFDPAIVKEFLKIDEIVGFVGGAGTDGD